jgi:hypothetical protein
MVPFKSHLNMNKRWPSTAIESGEQRTAAMPRQKNTKSLQVMLNMLSNFSDVGTVSDPGRPQT